jgi:hypothetical protein
VRRIEKRTAIDLQMVKQSRAKVLVMYGRVGGSRGRTGIGIALSWLCRMSGKPNRTLNMSGHGEGFSGDRLLS